MIRRTVLAVGLAVGLGTGPALGETVVAALSQNRVDIRSNFAGTELVLFGSIECDAVTVGRPDGYDVVVVVEGPDGNVLVWEKARVAGIWVNRENVEFRDAPFYYAVLSTRPLSEISGPPVLTREQIGLEFMKLQAVSPDNDAVPFREALIRRKMAQDLYFELPEAVSLLTSNMFMAHIPLPANISTGGYRARVHVFAGGALLTTTRLGFWVIKSGVEAAIFNLAHRQPLIYGLATVAKAVGIGWLGSVLFRRD